RPAEDGHKAGWSRRRSRLFHRHFAVVGYDSEHRRPPAPPPMADPGTARRWKFDIGRWLLDLCRNIHRAIRFNRRSEIMITLRLPDGSVKQVPEGTRPCDVAES